MFLKVFTDRNHSLVLFFLIQGYFRLSLTSFLCYNPNHIYVWHFVYPNFHPVWTIYSNILTQISQSQKQLISKKNSAMETDNTKTTLRPASLRWKILRQALLRRSSPQNSDEQSQIGVMNRISRKPTQGFNLIPCQLIEKIFNSRDARVCYTLPVAGSPKLFLTQRVDNHADLGDFEICNRCNIDNTGLVCHWPSEDILAFFSLSHADMFRSKRVIELGSGYGLAGLVIAATTEALEVVISDGNPQVVDYIQRNVDANSGAFGGTTVKSMALHWNQDDFSYIVDTFDVIVASDCTFFKEFHKDLARIIKFLLKKVGPSEALFFSPKRGDSLDKFLEEIEGNHLHFSILENYNAEIWKRHQMLMSGDESWPNYDKDHCYPFLVRITL